VLPLLVIVYGVGAAGAALLQARRLLQTRSSCETSALFLAVYAGGYALWLVYGLSLGSPPLVIVNGAGLVSAATTLAVALSLRGSLLSPSTWKSCRVPGLRGRRAGHSRGFGSPSG
jgi:MtN3 and saliva related transmembrane protein